MEQRPNNVSFKDSPNNEQLPASGINNKKPGMKIWKNKFAFWVLGLNNAFGYVVAIVAAKDILHTWFPEANNVEKRRHCSLFTTGFILIVLNVPAFLIQFLQVFLRKCVGSVITASMVLSISGYFMLAFTNELFLAFPGLILLSFGYGIGESQLSERSMLYEYKISRCFRHGVIDALIIGSIYYTVMRMVGVSMFYIFISLPILPALAIICFWCLLSPPLGSTLFEREDSQISLAIFSSHPKLVAFEDKMRYILHLLKNFIPLGFIIFFDGFVNQGIYEFVYFRGNMFDHFSQYRLYICLHDLGLYACLVTKNLLLVRHVWKCTMLHLIVVGVFLSDAILFYARYLWYALVLSYLQGIITGVAYTSTNYRMYSMEPSSYLKMAESTLKNVIYVVAILSGILDFAVHYFLSRTPEPSRP